MVSDIKKIIVNGNPTEPRELKKIISAISNDKILMEKGGYLFMVRISGDCCNLGIQPYQIGAERKYHYELNLPKDDFLLTGFINVNRSITLLFKVTLKKYKKGLSLEEKSSFREIFIKFARFLLDYGFPGDFEIDPVTRALLVETGIVNNAPINIEDLGKLPIRNLI